MCTAAILAGGAGRRLGGLIKPLISIGGRRIIDRQLTALRPVVDTIALVTTPHADLAGLDELGLPIWEDERPSLGPLGGILTALVNSQAASTLIVAGDMPFLTATFLRHLIEMARGSADAVIPRTAAGYQPLCGVYRRRCIAAIRRRLDVGALTVTQLLSDLRVREIGETELARLDPGGTLFFNVNTPADYERSVQLSEQPSLDGSRRTP